MKILKISLVVIAILIVLFVAYYFLFKEKPVENKTETKPVVGKYLVPVNKDNMVKIPFTSNLIKEIETA